jgi:excisionase family DNA binding protein
VNLESEKIEAIASAVASRIAERQTVAQAAEYRGRTLDVVKHLIAEGSLPVVRSDRRVFLDRADLNRWIEQHKEKTA